MSAFQRVSFSAFDEVKASVIRPPSSGAPTHRRTDAPSSGDFCFQLFSVSAFEMLNAPFMPQEQPVGLTYRPRTSMLGT